MGEFELLERIRERLPQPGARVRLGSGDDAAITVPGGATATSVDALVDGVHFRREWSSLAQIGSKALAVALSDLAAMGAEPGEAYVVLGIPTDLDEDGCLELLDGIAECAARNECALLGGDVTRAPLLTLALTVVGHACAPEHFVTRGGACPGDALVVTGELGGAAGGLLVLEHPPEVMSHLSPHTGNKCDRDKLIARQLEPRPRIEAGRALAAAGATAMIDLSDGLGGDAVHIAAASGVGLRISAAALPLEAGVAEVASGAGRDPIELATSGGEDYELLAALPADRLADAASAVARRAGTKLTRIGDVVVGEGVEIRLPDGGLLTAAGFDQLD
ncbi:MAG TPA: thiamine-phosphate kinase [Solirubrobacterales bacterium]|nr:thiamine-phosphate kinase [Solirubrobacterales bacterium]